MLASQEKTKNAFIKITKVIRLETSNTHAIFELSWSEFMGGDGDGGVK